MTTGYRGPPRLGLRPHVFLRAPYEQAFFQIFTDFYIFLQIFTDFLPIKPICFSDTPRRDR